MGFLVFPHAHLSLYSPRHSCTKYFQLAPWLLNLQNNIAVCQRVNSSVSSHLLRKSVHSGRAWPFNAQVCLSPPLPAPNLYSNFTSCSNNISKEKHTRPRHIFPFNHYSNSNSMQKGGGGRGWGGRVLLFSATVLASTGLKPDSLLVTRGIVKSCMCLQYCKRAIMRFQNLVRILFPEMSPFFPIL